MIPIAKAGWRFIGIGLAAAAIGCALGLLLHPLAHVVTAGGVFYALFSIYFFRDPERPLPSDPRKIYSPGDGRVMTVAKEGAGDTVTLRIFLSPLDVHIQRAPVAGTVDAVRYYKGSFLAAMKPEARANERCVLRLKPEGREALEVEQIAGFLARSIECWPKEGALLKAGERYGLIHFGSQAAVHFPASAVCTVKPGDRVAAGLSVIGEWKS